MNARLKAVWYAALKAAFWNSLSLQCGREVEKGGQCFDAVLLSAYVDSLLESGERPGTWREVLRLGVSRVEYFFDGFTRVKHDGERPGGAGWTRLVTRPWTGRAEFREDEDGELVEIPSWAPPDGVPEGSTHLPANLRRGGSQVLDFRFVTGNGDVWEVDFDKMARPRRVLRRAK